MHCIKNSFRPSDSHLPDTICPGLTRGNDGKMKTMKTKVHDFEVTREKTNRCDYTSVETKMTTNMFSMKFQPSFKKNPYCEVGHSLV